MQEQDHDASRWTAGEPGDRPEGEPEGPGMAGSCQRRMGSVILRGAAVLLDMLAWWPEAVVAGQTCLAALEIRQGTDRDS